MSEIESLDTFFLSLSDEQKMALVKVLTTSSSPKPEVVETPTEAVQTQAKAPTAKRKRSTVVNEDFTVTRENSIGAKAPVRAKANQWKDTGEAKEEGFDPKRFEEMGMAPRERPEKVMVEKTCHVCQRSFTMDPDVVYGEFARCNRCIG
jgi:hypothetical protein